MFLELSVSSFKTDFLIFSAIFSSFLSNKFSMEIKKSFSFDAVSLSPNDSLIFAVFESLFLAF